MTAESSTPRRRNNLTDEDIQKIVTAINGHDQNCKFTGVDPDDLKEAIEFYKNFNELMKNSKKTVFDTLLKLGVGAICALLLLGLLAKFGKISITG